MKQTSIWRGAKELGRPSYESTEDVFYDIQDYQLQDGFPARIVRFFDFFFDFEHEIERGMLVSAVGCHSSDLIHSMNNPRIPITRSP